MDTTRPMAANPVRLATRGRSVPTKDQFAHLASWIDDALGRMPYFNKIILAFRTVNAPGLGTFAVDDRMRLYIDFEAVIPKGHRWCSESLLHEVGHIWNEHAARARDISIPMEAQPRKDWNIACFPAGTLLPFGKRIETVATMRRHFDGDLVRIDTQAGDVEATPEHPFYVRTRRHAKHLHPIVLNGPEWVEAKNVIDSDYVLVPRLSDKRSDTSIDLTGYAMQYVRSGTSVSTISNRTVTKVPLDADTAWLIGLYVAEGSASPFARFSLGSHEQDLIERVEKVAAQIGFSASRSVRGTSTSVDLGAVVFARWLKEQCGDGAKNKHVPAVILHHADSEIRSAFLAGVVAGDGNDPHRPNGSLVVKVGVASRALMHDLVLLLAQDGLGARTRVSEQVEGRVIKGGAPLPAGQLYWTEWDPEGPRTSERTMNGCTITSTSHKWRSDEDGVWYPVRSVSTRAFSGEVYNMETESHTYVAHGMLVHNCDFAINDDLVEAGCTTLSDMLPDQIGEDRHLTAEHYYGVIAKARAAHPQHSCGSCGSPTKPNGQSPKPHQPGQGQPGQGQPGGECPDCGGTVPVFAGCGSGSGAEPAPGELGADDLGGYAAGSSQAEVDDMLIGTAQDIVDHVAKGRGKVPGSILAAANLLIAPSKVPWQRVLSTNLRRAYGKMSGKTRATYARRDRRRHNVRFGAAGEKVIYPGSISPKLRILVVRDTSGSMSAADLNAVGSEVVAIAKSLHVKDEYLQVMDVDARVHAVVPYRSVTSLVDVRGRGGTDMCVGIEAAVAMKPRPDIVVVATDGMTPWPDAATPFPVIACLVGSYAESAVSSVPDWMTSVVIEEVESH